MFQAMVAKLLTALNAIEFDEQELAESDHRFDDAEHRFRGLLAQTIELFAVRCPQPPPPAPPAWRDAQPPFRGPVSWKNGWPLRCYRGY